MFNLANKVKFSVSFTEELMAKIDEYRSTNGLSRAGVIQHCVLNFFEQRDQMKMLPEMNSFVKMLSEDKERIKNISEYYNLSLKNVEK